MSLTSTPKDLLQSHLQKLAMLDYGDDAQGTRQAQFQAPSGHHQSRAKTAKA